MKQLMIKNKLDIIDRQKSSKNKKKPKSISKTIDIPSLNDE